MDWLEVLHKNENYLQGLEATYKYDHLKLSANKLTSLLKGIKIIKKKVNYAKYQIRLRQRGGFRKVAKKATGSSGQRKLFE